MSPATVPTYSSKVISDAAAHDSSTSSAGASSKGAAPAHNGHRAEGNGSVSAAVPHDVIDRLAVYVAGPHDDVSVAELVARTGASRPDGALMVAAADGKLLAAGSMSDGAVVSEPSASGAAAAAVVRYRIVVLRRRRGAPRLAAA